MKGCKWLCIIAYILAALGSLILYANTIQGKNIRVDPMLIKLYALGALVTLYCSFRWALSKDIRD